MTIPTDRPITAEDCGFPKDWGRTRAVIALETEFVQPLIKRTFEIMRERGMIPEEPMGESPGQAALLDIHQMEKLKS